MSSLSHAVESRATEAGGHVTSHLLCAERPGATAAGARRRTEQAWGRGAAGSPEEDPMTATATAIGPRPAGPWKGSGCVQGRSGNGTPLPHREEARAPGLDDTRCPHGTRCSSPPSRGQPGRAPSSPLPPGRRRAGSRRSGSEGPGRPRREPLAPRVCLLFMCQLSGNHAPSRATRSV